MKDIKKQFEELKKKLNPDGYGYADITIYGRLIEGKNLSMSLVEKWFNKLIEKSDWKGTPKKEVLEHLGKLNVGFYKTKNGLK